MNDIKKLPWQIQSILHAAMCLQATGTTGASTGEQIAAAFVLNNMEYLQANYRDVIEAWERIEDWQRYVKYIKAHLMHRLE
jgi:hypothetical protein